MRTIPRYGRTMLMTLLLTMPLAASAQSWLIPGLSPLQDPPPGTATAAITNDYFSGPSQQASSGVPPIRLVPSYVQPTPLAGVSLYYDADTGSHGKISDIGNGQTLIYNEGPTWGTSNRVVPPSSLTIVNTYSDGSRRWSKILD